MARVSEDELNRMAEYIVTHPPEVKPEYVGMKLADAEQAVPSYISSNERMEIARERDDAILWLTTEARRRGYRDPSAPGRPGHCFEDSFRYVVQQQKGTLVHGTVWAPNLERRIQHAWVELPYGYVWEPSTGREYTIEAYNYDVAPVAEQKYTPEEASILAARTGNLGPWSQAERERWL